MAAPAGRGLPWTVIDDDAQFCSAILQRVPGAEAALGLNAPLLALTLLVSPHPILSSLSTHRERLGAAELALLTQQLGDAKLKVQAAELRAGDRAEEDAARVKKAEREFEQKCAECDSLHQLLEESRLEEARLHKALAQLREPDPIRWRPRPFPQVPVPQGLRVQVPAPPLPLRHPHPLQREWR